MKPAAKRGGRKRPAIATTLDPRITAWVRRCSEFVALREEMDAHPMANVDCVRNVHEYVGMGLREFGRHVGLSGCYLSRLERGEAKPTPEVNAKLDTALVQFALDYQARRVADAMGGRR